MSDLAALNAGRAELGLSVHSLWIEYFALGGLRDLATLAAYLDGQNETSDRDHDLIALALNEAYHDRQMNHPVPYRLP